MEQYNDEIQLKDILIKFSEYKKEIWKKKGKIILFSFLFFVLGVTIAFLSTTRYKANLTFVVEDAKGGNPLGAMTGIASQFGFNLGGTSSTTSSQQNIMQLLKSRGVVESALLRKKKLEGKNDLDIISPLKNKLIDDFFIWSVIGVIIGGRLGYVIFYQTNSF